MFILSSFFSVIKENVCIAILFVNDIVKCLHDHCVVDLFVCVTGLSLVSIFRVSVVLFTYQEGDNIMFQHPLTHLLSPLHSLTENVDVSSFPSLMSLLFSVYYRTQQ